MTEPNQSTSSWLIQWGVLLGFVVLMYFILIRPQKKRDKEVADMRSSLAVGDEVVTIGGICGKILKVTDESVVIQGGADKTKFEIKKWAISSVESKASQKNTAPVQITEPEEKKVKPKRLGRKNDDNQVDSAVPAAEEIQDAASSEETGFEVN